MAKKKMKKHVSTKNKINSNIKIIKKIIDRFKLEEGYICFLSRYQAEALEYSLERTELKIIEDGEVKNPMPYLTAICNHYSKSKHLKVDVLLSHQLLKSKNLSLAELFRTPLNEIPWKKEFVEHIVCMSNSRLQGITLDGFSNWVEHLSTIDNLFALGGFPSFDETNITLEYFDKENVKIALVKILEGTERLSQSHQALYICVYLEIVNKILNKHHHKFQIDESSQEWQKVEKLLKETKVDSNSIDS